jgi:hypothetical protein
MKTVLSLLLSISMLGLMTGCASTPPQLAVAADAATTAAALSSVPGAVEANPAGWLTIPIRLALIEHAKHQPIAEGLPIIHGVTAASWGAAASNTLVLFGATVPISAPVGVAVWWAVWKHGADEREFWHICDHVRKQDPEKIIACEFQRS